MQLDSAATAASANARTAPIAWTQRSVANTGRLRVLKVDYDWTEEVGRITAQTLLVFADADSVRPAHIVEFYALLGGGLPDAHWDGSLRPAKQLAMLPGLTHYDISTPPSAHHHSEYFRGK